MTKKPTDEQLFDNDAREFMRQVMVKVAEGQTVSCYFTFGIKPSAEHVYDIPAVDAIQPRLLKDRLSSLGFKLGSEGRAQLHTTGLTDQSVATILTRVVKQGYRAFKHNTPNAIGSAEYWIETQACEYTNKYCSEVTDQYREAL